MTTDTNTGSKVQMLIIGSGFAGLAAAIEAAEAGARVLVLEKMKGPGGNSIISDGVMAVAGSAEQKAAGIDDSPEKMAVDMLTAGLGLNHPDLIRMVTENSVAAFKWARDHLGVVFQERLDQFGGHSVPRCHTTANKTGADIIKKMLVKCRELGVEIRTRAYLEKFVVDDTGRVCGVSFFQDFSYPQESIGEPVTLKADAAVLATGGFGADIGFRRLQDPRLGPEIDSTNKPSATAEGLVAALALGAAPVHLSHIQLGPWTSPDEKMFGAGPAFASYVAFPYGLMVDPQTGRRFINELADRKIRADAILALGHPGLAVCDASNARASGFAFDRAVTKGVVKAFDRVDDIIDFYQVPAAAFRETFSKFNQAAAEGTDSEFGKPILSGAGPLVEPPFYAMRVWPKVHHTMGGVAINDQAQVLDLNGRPIQGLLAAGEVTGGVHGGCRLGSCAITECLVMGRIAGKHGAALGKGETF
jgi:flavocytochrome c